MRQNISLALVRIQFVTVVIITNKCQGVLIDDVQGMHSTKNVYSDLDINKLETLAPTQPHRNVDLTLVEADAQGVVCSLNIDCAT